jgi:hypothetical protein
MGGQSLTPIAVRGEFCFNGRPDGDPNDVARDARL